MLKNQRFAYDQAIRMVGTHIVEIETIADLDAALTEPVAMIAVLGTQEAESPGAAGGHRRAGASRAASR